MHIKFVAAWAIAVALVVSLIGCSATKYKGRFYDGPELPKSKVATVVGDNLGRFFNNQSVYVCKVDDNKVEMSSDNSIDILPGEHKLLLLYDGGNIHTAVELTFTVEEGHKYLVSFDKKGVMETNFAKQFTLWVVDSATEQHVKDVRSSSLKSQYSCF